MRRLLFVFLLVFLPLQFSAAALMPYCQHEGDADWHLGHHTHQHGAHAATVADADGDGGSQPTSPDLDCSHCHAHGAVMPAVLAPLPPATPRDDRRLSTPEHGPTRALAPPDRPQWPALA